MALNKEVFKTRSLTAAIFVVVMLAGLFWNLQSFIILFTIIHFGCWYEFVKLMKQIHGPKYLLYSLVGLLYITMPVLMMMGMGDLYYTLENKWPARIGGNEIPVVYSPLIPCIIIASIWINDTMAYVVGSLIGKTPFSKISPKKTWEGTAGGALLCVAVISLLAYLVPIIQAVIGVGHCAAIAAICAVFGTAGDLLESKIKRMAGVKDSGSFMPGHGGFLDRFDSLLVATPFVWLYIWLFV